MASFEIRRARTEDAPAIAIVLQRSITELCGADHKDDPAVLARWLANKTPEIVATWIANDANFHIVAEADDVILGVGCARGEGEIMLNYVSPDARFRGVSTALIAALEAQLRAQGCRRCTYDSTATARGFYTTRGYLATGVSGMKFGLPNFPMGKAL